MAETLGVVSGIIAVADLTFTVLGYLKSVHDAGKEVQDYNREAPNFAELLTSLAVHVTQSGGQNGDPWFQSVQSLQRGPMQQYQAAVERFKEKVAPGTGICEKFTQRITWKFVRDDVCNILAKTERLKSLVIIALQKDHLQVFSCHTNPYVRHVQFADVRTVNCRRQFIPSHQRSEMTQQSFAQPESDKSPHSPP